MPPARAFLHAASRRFDFAPKRKDEETSMAERSRTRRNTLERRCLGKAYKRLFMGSAKGIFKMLEKVKKA
jgi:hypothetical protein